jgi:hypothetical protein
MQANQIEIAFGRLKIREIVLELAQGKMPEKVVAQVGHREVAVKHTFRAPELLVAFEGDILVEEADVAVKVGIYLR